MVAPNAFFADRLPKAFPRQNDSVGLATAVCRAGLWHLLAISYLYYFALTPIKMG
jgi:hypothetical protein